MRPGFKSQWDMWERQFTGTPQRDSAPEPDQSAPPYYEDDWRESREEMARKKRANLDDAGDAFNKGLHDAADEWLSRLKRDGFCESLDLTSCSQRYLPLILRDPKLQACAILLMAQGWVKKGPNLFVSPEGARMASLTITGQLVVWSIPQ